MARHPQMPRELAESVAIQALGFIAEEPERLNRFLALSGLGSESLRAAAQEPNFLLGVLDHLASDETLLMDFAGHLDLAPEDVSAARDLLAGAPPPVS